MNSSTKKEIGKGYEHNRSMYTWYTKRYEYIKILPLPQETKNYALEQMKYYRKEYLKYGGYIST